MSNNKELLRLMRSIIAGNNVQRGEIYDLYMKTLKDAVAARVENYFAGRNMETTVKHTIRQAVFDEVKRLAKKDDPWGRSDLTAVERMVRQEVEAQVKELVAKHVRIELITGESSKCE